MKVQTKITLLLAVIVAAFVGGILALHGLVRAHFEPLAKQREQEHRQSFEHFLERVGSPLEMMVRDNSLLDDLADALKNADKAWAATAFSAPVLKSFDVNAVWIYGPDGRLFFSTNNLYAAGLAEIPLPKEAPAQLFTREHLRHFFIWLPEGLLEIRGATIHPSLDTRRESASRGSLLAGRFWSNANIQEMSLFSANLVRVEAATSGTSPRAQSGRGKVSFVQPLFGWDGNVAAQIAVENESPVFHALDQFTRRLLVWTAVFAVAMFLCISIFLTRWVTRPLRWISQSLAQRDLAPLQPLERDHSEFGRVAVLIGSFFFQQEKLRSEIGQRQSAEAALQRTEDQLRQAQKMEAIGRLAGGIAHDFNNLLTAIIGYADLLVRRAELTTEARHDAGLIRKAGEQAAGLTRQLLAFSRKQLLQPRVLDLNELVRGMDSLIRRLIGERIELRTRIESADARIRADAGQIEQVLLNLAVNARDAMPDGGVLHIRTANRCITERTAEMDPGDYLMLEVSDDGIGMDADTQAHIFEPFFTTKDSKGTGLGLATVYGIVKQSGGSISVESAPGKGCVFRICLPRAEAPLSQPESVVETVSSARRSETVLVAEDDQTVRELICTMLASQGYEVLCALDGEEALRLAAKYSGEIAILVTDVIMPQMNGPQLVRALAKTRPSTRVLYISGYSDADIQSPGTPGGPFEVLQKPFTPQQLIAKIRSVIEQPAPNQN